MVVTFRQFDSSDWQRDSEAPVSGSATPGACCSSFEWPRHWVAPRCPRWEADIPVDEPKPEGVTSKARSWTRTRSSNWSASDFEALRNEVTKWGESLTHLPRLDANCRTLNAVWEWTSGNLNTRSWDFGAIFSCSFPTTTSLFPQDALSFPTWIAWKTSDDWFSGEHNLEISSKYRSVLLWSNEKTRFSLCKMHWSLVVSKIPPNCSKAFLLKRNGVLPGTTSMANHNFLGVLAWRSRGIWILYELVSDWLFPKRKVTLLGTCFTWESISGGRCLRSCWSTFSPMIHLLAPVSRIAWHGFSHEAVKHCHMANIRNSSIDEKHGGQDVQPSVASFSAWALHNWWKIPDCLDTPESDSGTCGYYWDESSKCDQSIGCDGTYQKVHGLRKLLHKQMKNWHHTNHANLDYRKGKPQWFCKMHRGGRLHQWWELRLPAQRTLRWPQSKLRLR